ncbi:MAG: hypothetical protein [Bacteriophage sp.]|nr:MAG: hypothetical protein [Bacteriophage sp.]
MILSTPSDKVLKAFAEARRLMIDPKKNRNNTRSNYADLTAVAEAINPALEEAGLILIQAPIHKDYQQPGVLIIETIIIHTESGQSMTFESQIPLAKNDAQGFGSSNTYIRRYAKMSIFDLNATDDDGVKAIKTASDWKREMMAATDIGELDAMSRTAAERFPNDKASLQILRDAYTKRKVELEQGGAVPFDPGKTGNAKRGRVAVAPVNADNQPPQQPQEAPPVEGDMSDF